MPQVLSRGYGCDAEIRGVDGIDSAESTDCPKVRSNLHQFRFGPNASRLFS
jgi:hypothetical protein